MVPLLPILELKLPFRQCVQFKELFQCSGRLKCRKKFLSVIKNFYICISVVKTSIRISGVISLVV
jgi:hypothetical protein